EQDHSPNQSHDYPTSRRQRLPAATPQHRTPQHRTPRTRLQTQTPQNNPRQYTHSDEGLSDLERSSPIPVRSSPVVEARSRHATATPHRTPANRRAGPPPRAPTRPENARSTTASTEITPQDGLARARAPTAPPRVRPRTRYQSSSPMVPQPRARAQGHFQTPEQRRRAAPQAPGRRAAQPAVRGAGVAGAGRRGISRALE